MENWNTRISLLDRAKHQDDQEAWEEFSNYYKSYILMVLNRMQIKNVDLDDLSQNILLKIWQNLNKFKVDGDRAQFRTWLSTLIRNQALDDIKSSKRYHKRVDEKKNEAEKAIDQSHLVDEELNRIIEIEWEKHLITLALNNLKELFSEQAIYVFEQSLLGKSSQELSNELSIKPNSVNKLKNRVKERMIEEVKHLRTHLGM